METYGTQYAKSWATYLVSPEREMLAMTRSIGDFSMKQYGVSPVPSMQRIDAPPTGTTRAIVVASDGLWDGMKYADVCAI